MAEAQPELISGIGYPCYAEYNCSHCKSRWNSINAWKGKGKECQKCHKVVFPFSDTYSPVAIYKCLLCKEEFKTKYAEKGIRCRNRSCKNKKLLLPIKLKEPSNTKDTKGNSKETPSKDNDDEGIVFEEPGPKSNKTKPTKTEKTTTTPFQDDPRSGLDYPCYAEYKCSSCQSTFKSVKAWINKRKDCKDCETEAFPLKNSFSPLYYYKCLECSWECRTKYIEKGVRCRGDKCRNKEKEPLLPISRTEVLNSQEEFHSIPIPTRRKTDEEQTVDGKSFPQDGNGRKDSAKLPKENQGTKMKNEHIGRNNKEKVKASSSSSLQKKSSNVNPTQSSSSGGGNQFESRFELLEKMNLNADD